MRNTLSIFLLASVLSLAALLNPGPVRAQDLASLDAAGLGISLEESGPDYRILIKPKGGIASLDKDLTANVFAVENPSRLVIDIPGFIAKGSKKTTLDTATFAGFRLGAHQDKTRLVVDIKDNKTPDYSVAPNAELGAVVVSFGFNGNNPAAAPFEEPTVAAVEMIKTSPASLEPKEVIAEEKKPKAPAVKVAITPPPAIEEPVLEEPSAPEIPSIELSSVVPSTSEEQAPEAALQMPKEPQAVEIPEPKEPTGGIGIVKGVYYQAAKNSKTSSVMVDVDGLNQYSLSQTAPGSYELLLQDSQLKGPHLSLPQFPPDTFKGFEVIVASQVGKNVVVKVYTDKDVKLSPFIAQGKLWLRVAN